MAPSFASVIAEEAAAFKEASALLKKASCKAFQLEPEGGQLFGLKLGRVIGTPSQDAIVRVAILPSGRKVACKVQRAITRAMREAMILDELTTSAMGGSIHLPVTFGSVRCDNQLVTFSELMDGDLQQWFTKRPDGNRTSATAYGSAAAQVIFAFAQLHNHGIFHCDSHWAQVLYKKISPGGVWHYRISGQDFYVQNCGYLFKVFDFGQSDFGKCPIKANYNDVSENLYHALGPFHSASLRKRHNALTPDNRTSSLSKRIVKWSVKLKADAAQVAAFTASSELAKLPGVSMQRPRDAHILNSKPMVIA